ncbi:peptidylprolyl isomerase [Alkalihalobacillus pseudalcaliphilus]|uniref:peptidylprolyl isomerase n=1 Tax=Alkalihalobacillus pseudalcaliphilus TaxID=79884 RepID=UPI00064DD1EE|nr:peptidylprolyl isomerase [Alkalihalobacillus pseudalcaliphilus]KMK75681.1 foldase [Alkalihalobacillus pseudalcaliphilus]
MKKYILSAVGLAAFAMLAACTNDDTANDDTVVVVVNGTEITEGEFVELLKERYGEMTLTELVQLKAIHDQRENSGITQEEIDEELEYLKTNFQAESDEELLELVAAQNGIAVDTIEEFVDGYIIPPLIIDALAKKDVEVTEEDKQAYYEENQNLYGEQIEASHILVTEEEEAEEVLQLLNDGGDFAELAQEYSIDGSASRGGELGYFAYERMVPEFSEAAFALEVGETSGLVESEYGFHIIKVTGKKTSYEDFEEEIQNTLEAQQARSGPEVLQEILADADIDVKDSRFTDLFTEEESTEEASEE